MRKVMRHEMEYLAEPAVISTVELCEGLFETMVMWEDGEEIELPVRTRDEAEAVATHMELVERWREKLFEGSIAKLVGGTDRSMFVRAAETA